MWSPQMTITNACRVVPFAESGLGIVEDVCWPISRFARPNKP